MRRNHINKPLTLFQNNSWFTGMRKDRHVQPLQLFLLNINRESRKDGTMEVFHIFYDHGTVHGDKMFGRK